MYYYMPSLSDLLPTPPQPTHLGHNRAPKVSQKEILKNIPIHIYVIWKNGTEEPICIGDRDTALHDGHVDTGWGRWRVG